MPKNNSKARKDQRRRDAITRMRLHVANPDGCGRLPFPHAEIDHIRMRDEADRIADKYASRI